MKIFIGMLYSGLVGATGIIYKKKKKRDITQCAHEISLILETLAESHLEEGDMEILVGQLRGRRVFSE